MDNIGGNACEAVGDFDRSLGSRYFVCVVNERASFASFDVLGDSSDFSVLLTKKSLMFLLRLNEMSGDSEKILLVSSFSSNL